jgi:CheY-like chemotaxis protein
VSRILEGKLRLDVQPTDLQSVISAALDTVRPAAEAKGVRLQTALSSNSIVVGDAHRLQQVVWNLLSNAVKFTPRGGRVHVLLESVDSAVQVTVSDTGAGISAEFLPHVFERFRQGDGGTTRVQGGLGLGLSIVRHLVEMHGGNVLAISDGVGRGSQFVVRLPLAVSRRTDTTPTASLREMLVTRGLKCPPGLDGLRTLVVDDEEDAREIVKTLLEQCGASVMVAQSASRAFDLFKEHRPAIVLSDVGMPGEDGYSLISKIRALPAAAGGDTPAVALTAYARTEDRTQCLLAGFSSHLPKPIEPLELLAVVASLSGRRSLRE